MSGSDKKSALVVVHNLPARQALVNSNRRLMAGVLALMAIIAIGGLYWLPGHSPSPAPAVAYGHAPSPRLSADMEALRAQVTGLVSGSIESKLKTLEDSLRAGSLSASLSAIDDIRRDIRLLNGYPPADVANPPSAQARPPADKGQVVQEPLIEEVAHLKRLVYFIIASCALMFAAIAGVWVRQHRLPFNRAAIGWLHKR